MKNERENGQEMKLKRWNNCKGPNYFGFFKSSESLHYFNSFSLSLSLVFLLINVLEFNIDH